MTTQGKLGFANSRGVVLIRREGEISHFGVRFYHRQVRAFNKFVAREYRKDILNPKIREWLSPLVVFSTPPHLVYCGSFAETRVGLFFCIVDGYFVDELMANIEATRPFLKVGEPVVFNPNREMEHTGVKIYPIDKMEKVGGNCICKFFKEFVNRYRAIF